MDQDNGIKSLGTKERIARCIEWLKEQNNPKKLSLQNKNDIQFIIETNAHRKKFFLNAEDDATVPVGVDEVELEPRNVPVRKLRHERLCLECEWPSCREFFSNYSMFQVHVTGHIADVHVMEKDNQVYYVCLWDVCGHKTTDKQEIVRHINYHAYHAKLLAIGFNARATLKLERCKKDSSKRNRLPEFIGDHCCMWFGCQQCFDSMQAFLDHVRTHTTSCKRGEVICSWAGCGLKFDNRGLLTKHVRVHTGEKLIACYHCGAHFSLNRKITDHLLRQNVDPTLGHKCSICGKEFATDYLLREHIRRHVSCYACSLCDMSQPTLADLAHHMRYRHLAKEVARKYKCTQCEYRAVTNYDLRDHMKTHNRKQRDSENSDSEGEVKKQKERRKYVCHMCPENKPTIFSRGGNLTMHLLKRHGAQWPCGHSRFRYQKSEDGMYRLTTTRFEDLEISRRIVNGGRKSPPNHKYDYSIKKVADFTATSPAKFEIRIQNPNDTSDTKDKKPKEVKKEVTKINKDEFPKSLKRKTDTEKENNTKKPKKEIEGNSMKRKSKKNAARPQRKATKKKIAKRNVKIESPNKETDCDESMTRNEDEINLEDDILKTPVKKEFKEKEYDKNEHILEESVSLNSDITDIDKIKQENDKTIRLDKVVQFESGIKLEKTENACEIEMCDVDEFGNVVNVETIHSQIFYSYKM